MQSLRADLRDLQAAIADVSSRVGAVRVPSWKFPNKAACDVDMEELLELYDYTEQDPEFTQHSHVVLLELVIDRLLLLLQSFTSYTENLLSKRAVPPAQAAGPSMSAGLTARRYWSSMLKLEAFYQQLLAEKKALKKELPPLQLTPQAGSGEKQLLQDRLPDILERTSREATSATSRFPPLSSSHGIPTEATGTSLAPCAACAGAQAGLREVGRAITSICQSQNIPSALGKFQAAEESRGRGTLSARDVSYWASEQSKDLSRIE
ncbi:PREDICTED: coiled-coil domain-containing protein 157, partial [Merops nubicus]|uniref:coiled-coil domain-containing protein 157 n=1 Tax=Merops nubicus TaxID=57421 RepID=UPI0004F0882D